MSLVRSISICDIKTINKHIAGRVQYCHIYKKGVVIFHELYKILSPPDLDKLKALSTTFTIFISHNF